MRLGVCARPEMNELAAQAGFDYIECSLSAIAAMEESAFTDLAKKACSFPLPILKCNGFVPAQLKLTGPEASPAAWKAYLEKAFPRAHALGVETLALGSGGARQAPAGWPQDRAWRQMADFSRLAAQYAENYDLDIALEPLRRQECNLLNLVSEGTLLAAWVDHPRLRVLGDTFHMICCNEPYAALAQAGKLLRHVHISRPLPDLSDRVFPAPKDGVDYAALISVLCEMDYAGDISVEAGCKDFAVDGPRAVACLRPLMGD